MKSFERAFGEANGCGAPTALAILGVEYPAQAGWANLWRASGAQRGACFRKRALLWRAAL